MMVTKALLITYPGYPNEPFNLMPDNGLANLAACLMAKGHRVVIWDCMTADLVRRLFPFEHSKSLHDSTAAIIHSLQRGERPSTPDLDRYYRLDNAVQEYKKRQIHALGKELAEYVARERFDFVGMKLWTGDGFSGSLIIAEEIRRRNPGICLFGGGPHVDWFMEQIYDVTGMFDALCYGEGEEVITLLADYVEGMARLEEIPNLIFRKEGKVITTPGKVVEHLDTLPSPVYDETIYPAMRGDQKLKAVLVEESRGCPNSCHFCVHPKKSGKRRRLVSTRKVVDEMERLVCGHNIHAFRLSGSNPPAHHLAAIGKEIVRRKLSLRYSAYAHVRGFSVEDFALLKQSGCSALSFGVESGCQRILDKSMNKRISVAEIRDTLFNCRRGGIKFSVSIIMPAPLETAATQQETFELLQSVRPDSTIVCFPIIVRGTEWERNKDLYGFQIQNPANLFRKIMIYTVNHLAPPVLWEPLEDYRINDKSFAEIAKETASFTQRLEKENLATQLFDQTILLSEFSDMSPREFGNMTHAYLRNGDYQRLQSLVGAVNKRIHDSQCPH